MKNRVLKVKQMVFLAGILSLVFIKNDVNAAQVQAGGCTGLLPMTEEEKELN